MEDSEPDSRLSRVLVHPDQSDQDTVTHTEDLITFSDDWWVAGADSAEHYQQILLDSAEMSNGYEITVNLEPAVPAVSVTNVTNGKVRIDEAAVTANTELQTLPIRSRASQANADNLSLQVADRLLAVDDAEISTLNEASIETPDSPPHHAARESFDEIQLRLTNEFMPIVEYDWDTLVYIGPPAQEYGQDNDEYNYIKQHFSKPYLLHSATLKGTGSSEFARLLGPMSARAQRRLKKLGLHLNLPGNREPIYYVDLRPPQDDDAAVEMVTEMSCTPGVLSWHKQAVPLGIEKAVVGGTDSLNIIGRRRDLDDQPAYSPLRHHMAVERLLQTICGESPRLNSAPKLWSFVVIAKHLGCAQHPRVMSEVYSWLFSDRNSNFIQSNPEVTYRIARSLKAQDLMRVTYALLVGEKAILQRGFQTPTDSIVFKKQGGMRPLCHLDEDEVNRIDHAAQAFSSRIQSTFVEIANEPLSWMIGSVEVLKLLTMRARAPEDQATLNRAWTLLRKYIRNELHQALTENLDDGEFSFTTSIVDSTTGRRKILTKFTTVAYNGYSVLQRLMTRAFWEYLKVYGFRQDPARATAWLSAHTLDGMAELAPDYHNESSEVLPPRVLKDDLFDVFDDLKALIEEDAIYYPNTGTGKFPKFSLPMSEARLYECIRLNLLSEVGDVDARPSETFGVTVDSSDELAKTMRLLRLKNFSLFPPIGERPSATGNKVRESMKLLSDKPEWQWRSDGLKKSMPPTINFSDLLAELKRELANFIERKILTPGWANDEIGVENEIPIFDVESLLCINGDEWKYLPLWAGGLDDGSGGVFVEEHVPDMAVEEGFRGGKRGLSKVLDDLADVEMGEEGYSVVGSSDYEDIATEDGISTVGKASRVVTVGTRSTADTVMSLDE